MKALARSELPLTWDDALRRDTLSLAQDGQAAGVAPRLNG
jgi:hypothetical protein